MTRVFFLLIGLSMTVCACETSPEEQAVDTDISISTTDVESLQVGSEAECLQRLATVVDANYLREHDVEVPDKASAASAIANAIEDICAQADPDAEVHEAAHEVVHEVEERLK